MTYVKYIVAQRSELVSKLSALRDCGRLLLPNLSPDQHGLSKSSAYVGYRQRALDCLTATFIIAGSIDFQQQRNHKEPVILPARIPEGATQQKLIWQGLRGVNMGQRERMLG
jgi:hypothetical protein